MSEQTGNALSPVLGLVLGQRRIRDGAQIKRNRGPVLEQRDTTEY
jgi:hypothetical protein